MAVWWSRWKDLDASARMLCLGFAGCLVLGGVLLWLRSAHSEGQAQVAAAEDRLERIGRLASEYRAKRAVLEGDELAMEGNEIVNRLPLFLGNQLYGAGLGSDVHQYGDLKEGDTAVPENRKGAVDVWVEFTADKTVALSWRDWMNWLVLVESGSGVVKVTKVVVGPANKSEKNGIYTRGDDWRMTARFTSRQRLNT